MTVVNPMAAGELLAASAVEESGDGRVVAIGVDPGNMPPGVAHGSTIDLYLTKGGAAGAEAQATTELIGAGHHRAIRHRAGHRRAVRGHLQPVPALGAAPRADVADKLVRILPTGEPIVVLVSGG